MFNLIFLWVFTLALNFGNVYCFIKKKYLYLFIPCMLFLPDYYGYDISSSLPLMTTARMMFVTFYIYAWINRRRDLNLKSIKLRELPKEYLFLGGYFVFRIVSNLYYVTTYGQAAKTLFLIIFEQLLLLVAVYLLAPDREEIITLVKVIVWVAVALFVVGIIECIFSVKPFDALYTVGRNLYVLDYYRLGLLRATTTMYAPSIYGNMCILMFPLILYLYEMTRTKKYIVAAGLDVLAIIHSGSRADMIFLFAVILFYFVLVLRDKNRRFLFMKNTGIVAFVLVAYMCIASMCSASLKYYYVGTAKSLLNEVGFDFDLDEDAPEGAGGYGYNSNGSISRTRQFTGMYYVAKINPIFGLGSGADRRGEIKYYWHSQRGFDKWIVAYAYDVGMVEIFCNEGLMGLIGVCFLFVYMFMKSGKNGFYKLAIVCYLLSTLSTGNMFEFLMTYIIVFTGLGQKKSICNNNAQYI